MSRHHDEQYRWAEQLRSRLADMYSSAKTLRMPQADFLAQRFELLSGPTGTKRLTAYYQGYISGWLHHATDEQLRSFYHVRRFIGRPETATSAKWDDMTEEMRQAFRDGGKDIESTLCWDAEGKHPFSAWRTEGK